MGFKSWFIFALVILVVGGIVYNTMESQDVRDEVQALKKSQMEAKAAESLRSLEPPRDLIVARIPTDKIWFVGKHEDGGGVEIPFRPGEAPQITKDRSSVRKNPGFVGPEECKDCHAENYQSFLATAHFNTSQVVSASSIQGNFEPGANDFHSSDPNVHFEMIRRDDQFLQRVHFHDWAFEVPMEIIIGSSKMAQTYLYWHGDGLYQHNVTHISDGNQWINSPGYIDGDAAYARPIPERCLDCHMTYFDFRGKPNRFTPGSMIMGVTCERCHGPASDHVAFHREHKEAKQAKSITNPRQLERQAQMEVCGQCHGGSRDLKTEALRFRPGDRLDDHYLAADDEKDAKNSVHTSNQLTRLTLSRCFQQSEMTCIDCHDPHHAERGNRRLFSKRCMTCHTKESDCGHYPQADVNFASNCVDCHMPQRPTKKLRLKSIEGDVFPPLRDHFIRIDPQATKQFHQSH